MSLAEMGQLFTTNSLGHHYKNEESVFSSSTFSASRERLRAVGREWGGSGKGVGKEESEGQEDRVGVK